MPPEDAKKLILARRAKFVAAALAGMTGVATACGGSTSEPADPQPCLKIAPDSSVAADASGDATPQPCLEPLPPDSGGDAEPQPCLAPLPPDAGDGGDGG